LERATTPLKQSQHLEFTSLDSLHGDTQRMLFTFYLCSPHCRNMPVGGELQRLNLCPVCLKMCRLIFVTNMFIIRACAGLITVPSVNVCKLVSMGQKTRSYIVTYQNKFSFHSCDYHFFNSITFNLSKYHVFTLCYQYQEQSALPVRE
jgi:hypothetical protein